MDDDGLLEPPTWRERILGALLLPVALGLTVAVPLVVIIGMVSDFRPTFVYRHLGPVAAYALFAWTAIVAVAPVAGFVLGLGRATFLMFALWGTNRPWSERLTVEAWLVVIAVGAAGALAGHWLVR